MNRGAKAALAVAGAWLLAAAWPCPAAAQVIPAATTGAMTITQDAAGRVWAARGGYWAQQRGQPPGLYRWAAGRLQLVTPAPAGWAPRGMWPLGGGVVLAGRNGGLQWYHRGRATALAALGPQCHGLRRVFASQRTIYAICAAEGSIDFGAGAVPPGFAHLRIYRLPWPVPGAGAAAGARAALALRLGAAAMFPRARAPGWGLGFATPHLIRAGGAVWIWAGLPAIAPRLQILRGFVIVRGAAIHYQAAIPGLPHRPLEALGPWDQTHLAAAVLGGGIYLIDIAQRRARPLARPQAGDFRWVQKIFRAHGAHYLITTTPGRVLRLTPGHRLRDVLWRVQHGHWRRVIAGLDDLSLPRLTPQRPVLVTRGGFWLGTLASGIWWAPRKGRPRLFDWREGFPLRQVRALFALPAAGPQRSPGREVLAQGNTLAGGARWRLAAFAPALLLRTHARPPTPARWQVINPIRNFAPDAQGDVWGLVRSGGRQTAATLPGRGLAGYALGEWTGRIWRRYPLPAGIRARAVTGLDADEQGRIWLFPDCRLNWPMAVFQPAAAFH